MNLYELTIDKAHELLRKKEISSVELTEAVFKRIDETEQKIDAFITIDKDYAINQAKEADKKISEGKISYLTGIPLSIKDLICTKKIRTTCASKILEDFIPPYDAHVIEKLKAENAVILGKVNMDEFAMGSSTENSGFKVTKNPWDISKIPGGSSGGSSGGNISGTFSLLLICALARLDLIRAVPYASRLHFAESSD